MQVTRQAILRNTRSYKCLDTKSHWKWRRGLAMYCISSDMFSCLTTIKTTIACTVALCYEL